MSALRPLGRRESLRGIPLLGLARGAAFLVGHLKLLREDLEAEQVSSSLDEVHGTALGHADHLGHQDVRHFLLLVGVAQGDEGEDFPEGDMAPPLYSMPDQGDGYVRGSLVVQ